MRRRARRGGGRQVELTIEGIGARGDGYARLEPTRAGDGLVFVPFTVVGDRVRVRLSGTRPGGLKGEVVELIAEGPGRVAPPCPHFGPCGGCAVQHLAGATYVAWKQELVARALAQRGLASLPVRPLIRIPPGTRRRATLAAQRHGEVVRLGFHGRESHTVVDLSTCLLLRERLRALLPGLRAVLPAVLAEGEVGAVTVLDAEEGPDVLVVSGQAPDLTARERLAAWAETADLARLSWAARPRAGASLAPEPVVVRRPPRVRLGGIALEPPPGGFLQPTAEGQAALVDAVLANLPARAQRVADLYCGCGTFAFSLAQRARVNAVDGDAPALAALWAAARRADLAGRIAVEERDLARAPLRPEELARFDAAVFDPPRTGAREQSAALAGSSVPVVIAVSCNPNTFARDARILVEGGYALVEVAPIDQFPWSGHLELVALFRR